MSTLRARSRLRKPTCVGRIRWRPKHEHYLSFSSAGFQSKASRQTVTDGRFVMTPYLATKLSIYLSVPVPYSTNLPAFIHKLCILKVRC
jgi:hypothetical protein